MLQLQANLRYPVQQHITRVHLPCCPTLLQLLSQFFLREIQAEELNVMTNVGEEERAEVHLGSAVLTECHVFIVPDGKHTLFFKYSHFKAVALSQQGSGTSLCFLPAGQPHQFLWL